MAAPFNLATLPHAAVSLHPAPNTAEINYTPESIRDEERCRTCTNFGHSVHLIGHPPTNSITMIIDFGNPNRSPWRIHIEYTLWRRTNLGLTARGVEPLFDVHPLGWASEAHMQQLRRWGAERGIIVRAEQGRSGHLFMSCRS